MEIPSEESGKGGCWGGRWKGRDGAELSVDVVDVVVELVCREVSEGC